MHAVVRLVEEGQREQSPDWAFRDDAPSRTFDRPTGKADVLNLFFA